MESTSHAVSSASSTASGFFSPIFALTDATTDALTSNVSFFGINSTKGLVDLPFRFARQIDPLFRNLPRYLGEASGLLTATAEEGNIAIPVANIAGEGVGQVADTAGGAWSTIVADAFQASTFKSYLGMLQYLTSRWSFTCFAVALILNRVNVYGTSRQRIVLSFWTRAALRLVPIALLIPQIYHLLSGIHCQTSPEYSLYRHGDNNKYSMLDWSTDGGPIYTMTSTMLYFQSDEQSCAVVAMSRPEPDVKATHGSFSLLWPTFLRLALSHVVESLSCSLQQIPLMTEVGMSVFEHSLAFAEAESLITNTISILAREIRASNATKTATSTATPVPTSRPMVMASGTIMALSDAITSLASPHVLDRINVPVEVLLIALLSSCNALSSHILAVLGRQHRWRLVNTAIWGILFMTSFVWGFANTSIMSRAEEADPRPVSSLLHFPTVAIVGFLPHMLILCGMVVCFFIYFLALTLTAVSLGTNTTIPQPSSLKERFVIAHDNLTAAIQLRGLQIRWAEDFYTALLRVGFTALTAASEAVFLNEGRAVEMRQFTWLEEERLDELHHARDRQSTTAKFQILEEYGVPSSSPGGVDKGGVWESGYAKERKFERKEGELKGRNSFAYPTPRQDGVGAVQRTTRYYLLFIYMRGIMFLVAGWCAFGIGNVLDWIGITTRPRWLRRIVGRSLKEASRESQRLQSDANARSVDIWQGEAPDNLAMDIEDEMRRNISRDLEGETAETALDERMYSWWKGGGWFGTQDGSGDYAPSIRDEDITSVVSMSTAASSAENEWESEPEGTRTPTQDTANARQTWSFSGIETFTRESTPMESHIDTPLDAATLARLLNPQDDASREEGRILATHLSSSATAGSDRIMTRSQYRQQVERDRARVLLSGRRIDKSASYSAPSIPLYTASPQAKGSRPLTAEEESTALEALLLKRRGTVDPFATPSDRREGATDAGTESESGVLCVVCQTTSRTIIAWPCRCLCVCEDCRVSLAMNNFANCVTCRRSVSGFVRLYVP